jgi:hypothetical protein
MKKYLFILVLVNLILLSSARSQTLTKNELLEYAKAAADYGWNTHNENIESWKKSINLKYVFGYNPPGNDMYIAALYAHLYKEFGNKEYFKRAKELLVKYGEYRKAYPPDYFKTRKEYEKGLPALPNIFTGSTYCRAYILLKDEIGWTKEERATVEKIISESADYIINSQEWGPMNRAMLRAEFLASCVKALSNHQNRQNWEMVARSIGDDNFGKWEIEDATGYHAIWLYSLLNYGEFIGDESYLSTPTLHYYFKYFSQLLAPDYTIPEFGDADYNSGWVRFLPCLVKGAAVYKDPEIQWAAAKIFQKNFPKDKSSFSPALGLFYYDCYRWGNFNLKPEEPKSLSSEVLDDIVGKKIIFRDGWKENSNYLLLNYRDEGDGGLLFRDNLRNTIPVEEEKMHHGHSDENSISLLMSNGSILLRDGGYRDYMPSGPYGAFRQDYFHNKVCIRNNKIFKGQKEGEYRYSTYESPVVGQGMLEFFRNSGAYRKVISQKIDFLTFKEFDFSRTRVTDPKLKYEQDRLIYWIKDLNIYVVFDVVKFLEENYYTTANLWNTRKILNQDNGWYDTEYDTLRNIPLNTNTSLLIYFPEKVHKMEGVEEQNRNWQKEKVIYQMDSRHCNMGDMISFVTVLIPHKKGSDFNKILSSIKLSDLSHPGKTLGLKIISDNKTYYVCAKLDLDMDLIRDFRRPKYTYETGKVKFDDFETDGNNLFAIVEGNQVNYCISNTVKGTYKNQVMFEQLPVDCGLAFDGSKDAPGVFKVRYWKANFEFKK